MRYIKIISPQLGNQVLTVHEVFGATECYDVYFVFSETSGLHAEWYVAAKFGRIYQKNEVNLWGGTLTALLLRP
jgi:hypothetical protein